jgi:hypothetical protein
LRKFASDLPRKLWWKFWWKFWRQLWWRRINYTGIRAIIHRTIFAAPVSSTSCLDVGPFARLLAEQDPAANLCYTRWIDRFDDNGRCSFCRDDSRVSMYFNGRYL